MVRVNIERASNEINNYRLMRIKSELIVLIIITVILSNCTKKHSTKIVAVDRIDTSGIYFSYNFQNKNFAGHFDLEEIKEDFSTSDSLKIKIEKNQPENFEFISVIERIWKTEEAIVSITGDARNQNVYGYHSVDQKPLFSGADNEYENDSLIFDFVKKHSNPTNEFKKVGVYILINETGEVTLDKAITKNNEEIQLIKKLIKKLPKFSPPINDGDSVTVSFLIEIPIYN